MSSNQIQLIGIGHVVVNGIEYVNSIEYENLKNENTRLKDRIQNLIKMPVCSDKMLKY